MANSSPFALANRMTTMRDALKGALGDRYEPTVEPYRQRIRESGPKYFELATRAIKSIHEHAGEDRDGIIICLTAALVDVCDEKDTPSAGGGASNGVDGGE